MYLASSPGPLVRGEGSVDEVMRIPQYCVENQSGKQLHWFLELKERKCLRCNCRGTERVQMKTSKLPENSRALDFFVQCQSAN